MQFTRTHGERPLIIRIQYISQKIQWLTFYAKLLLINFLTLFICQASFMSKNIPLPDINFKPAFWWQNNTIFQKLCGRFYFLFSASSFETFPMPVFTHFISIACFQPHRNNVLATKYKYIRMCFLLQILKKASVLCTHYRA